MNTLDIVAQEKQLIQVCPSISKRGIKGRVNKPTKATGLSCRLTKTNNAGPGNEIERLAQQWCQLVMDQVQEIRSRQTLRSAFGK